MQRKREKLMKRVLVVDDEVIKYMAIKKALEFNGIREIQVVGNQETVWEEIEKAEQRGEKFDLVVTDMHYPLREREKPNPEAGFILLDEMKKRGYQIPVIICSYLNFREPRALGCVWYRENESLEFEFKDVLQRIK